MKLGPTDYVTWSIVGRVAIYRDLAQLPLRPNLPNPIHQRLTTFIPPQIIYEMLHGANRLCHMSTACMRRDVAIRKGPERVIRRQRFGVSYIQISSRQMPGSKSCAKPFLVRRWSATDVVIAGARLELPKSF